MSNQSSFQSTDKFEVHYRQQLSALIDGELSADETRFLLRRLEHDEELSGCHERWQLCGDILRGTACVPAPLDFAARVQAAVAAEPAPAASAASRGRGGWRWGGGAAIAASVAALALFMARERLPDSAAVEAGLPVVATTAQLPAGPAAPQPGQPDDPGDVLADAAAAVPAAALASARRQDAARRGRATRTQQARGVRAQQVPERWVAAAAAPAPVASPFAHPASSQARPWPRSVIAGSGDSPLNASFSSQEQPATFYPFEPRMPQPAVADPSLPPLPQP
jgi:negative regulator of sigma E activity